MHICHFSPDSCYYPAKMRCQGFFGTARSHIFNLDAVLLCLPNSAQMLSKSDCQLKDVITGRAASRISLSSCCLAPLTTADAACLAAIPQENKTILVWMLYNPPPHFLNHWLQKHVLSLLKRRQRWTVWVLQKRKIIPMVHNIIQQAR